MNNLKDIAGELGESIQMADRYIRGAKRGSEKRDAVIRYLMESTEQFLPYVKDPVVVTQIKSFLADPDTLQVLENLVAAMVSLMNHLNKKRLVN